MGWLARVVFASLFFFPPLFFFPSRDRVVCLCLCLCLLFVLLGLFVF